MSEDNNVTAPAEPFRCTGKHRIAAYNEHITVQLSYVEHTRVLNMLLYVGSSLSNKCTFRIDQSSDFMLNSDPIILAIEKFSSTYKIGFFSSIQYFPRILTLLEILKEIKNTFFGEAILNGTYLFLLHPT